MARDEQCVLQQPGGELDFTLQDIFDGLRCDEQVQLAVELRKDLEIDMEKHAQTSPRLRVANAVEVQRRTSGGKCQVETVNTHNQVITSSTGDVKDTAPAYLLEVVESLRQSRLASGRPPLAPISGSGRSHMRNMIADSELAELVRGEVESKLQYFREQLSDAVVAMSQDCDKSSFPLVDYLGNGQRAQQGCCAELQRHIDDFEARLAVCERSLQRENCDAKENVQALGNAPLARSLIGADCKATDISFASSLEEVRQRLASESKIREAANSQIAARVEAVESSFFVMFKNLLHWLHDVFTKVNVECLHDPWFPTPHDLLREAETSLDFSCGSDPLLHDSIHIDGRSVFRHGSLEDAPSWNSGKHATDVVDGFKTEDGSSTEGNLSPVSMVPEYIAPEEWIS